MIDDIGRQVLLMGTKWDNQEKCAAFLHPKTFQNSYLYLSPFYVFPMPSWFSLICLSHLYFITTWKQLLLRSPVIFVSLKTMYTFWCLVLIVFATWCDTIKCSSFLEKKTLPLWHHTLSFPPYQLILFFHCMWQFLRAGPEVSFFLVFVFLMTLSIHMGSINIYMLVIPEAPTWLSQLSIGLLISAQVMIPGWWHRAPHPALHWVWSPLKILSLPLPLPLPCLCVCMHVHTLSQ